jgi:hypothetical protein
VIQTSAEPIEAGGGFTVPLLLFLQEAWINKEEASTVIKNVKRIEINFQQEENVFARSQNGRDRK